jgi:hypothetical protein
MQSNMAFVMIKKFPGTHVVLTGGREELISSFCGGNISRPSRMLTAWLAVC